MTANSSHYIVEYTVRVVTHGSGYPTQLEVAEAVSNDRDICHYIYDATAVISDITDITAHDPDCIIDHYPLDSECYTEDDARADEGDRLYDALKDGEL